MTVTRLLADRVTDDEAHNVLEYRLDHREDAFLQLAREAIYEYSASPYLRLLRIAGCEYGDLEELVWDEGLEGALQELLRRGIYLTVDESRGGRTVVRGSETFEVEPGTLHDPTVTADNEHHSSGRWHLGEVPRPSSLARDQAIENYLACEALGGLGWVHATWEGAATSTNSEYVRYGLWSKSLARRFFLVGPAADGLQSRPALGERIANLTGLLTGVVPGPAIHVPLGDPMPIVRWLVDVLEQGRIPCLETSVSPAVRLCLAAYDQGISLEGACLIVGGEPITAARLEAIRRVGAEVQPIYGPSETGTLGSGCNAPEVVDEVHVHRDRFGVIQAGDASTLLLPSRALLVTTLLPRGGMVLLNTSIGDQAELVEEACGCPFEEWGMTPRLHTIRSFERLTVGSMTFSEMDVVHALDEVLPTRLGGGPTDYQLVDGEDEAGQGGLRLLLHPRLGPLDEEVVRQTFLQAVGQRVDADWSTASGRRRTDLLTIVRAEPHALDSGRILHVHLERTASGGEPRVPAEALGAGD